MPRVSRRRIYWSSLRRIWALYPRRRPRFLWLAPSMVVELPCALAAVHLRIVPDVAQVREHCLPRRLAAVVEKLLQRVELPIAITADRHAKLVGCVGPGLGRDDLQHVRAVVLMDFARVLHGE